MPTEEELSNMSQEEIAELQKKNCIFCKIVSGEVPSKKLYEDDKVIAIMDIRPAAKGHVLIMPKEHYPVLPLVPAPVAKHLFGITKELCSAVRSGIPALGTSVFMANGAAAGQQSPHFLYHVIPRDAADGLLMVESKETDQSGIAQSLKARFHRMVKPYLAREGKLPAEEKQEAVKNHLAVVLEKNPQVKQMLIQDPEKFRQAVSQNPQLQQLFQGIDIDVLSSKLRESEGRVPGAPPKDALEGGEGSEDQDFNKKDDEDPETDGHQEDEGGDDGHEGGGRADLDKIAGLFT